MMEKAVYLALAMTSASALAQAPTTVQRDDDGHAVLLLTAIRPEFQTVSNDDDGNMIMLLEAEHPVTHDDDGNAFVGL